MIYDCFSYWDEDLLLELRLNILNKIVDYPIHIKFDDMEICEDLQLSIFHYIKQRLISKYSDYFANCELPKYQKRTLEDLIS